MRQNPIVASPDRRKFAVASVQTSVYCGGLRALSNAATCGCSIETLVETSDYSTETRTTPDRVMPSARAALNEAMESSAAARRAHRYMARTSRSNADAISDMK